MGFASGTDAAETIWRKIKKLIPQTLHKKAARIIVDEFENLDTDDWDYSKGSVYHAAYPEECSSRTRGRRLGGR
jgi:hypothetical protein